MRAPSHLGKLVACLSWCLVAPNAPPVEADMRRDLHSVAGWVGHSSFVSLPRGDDDWRLLEVPTAVSLNVDPLTYQALEFMPKATAVSTYSTYGALYARTHHFREGNSGTVRPGGEQEGKRCRTFLQLHTTSSLTPES